MSILIFDPSGNVAKTEQRKTRVLQSIEGKRAGFVFNQHASAIAFWAALEQQVDRRFSPSSVHRVYKANTWSSAPVEDLEELVRQTDYAVVGVGA